MKRKTNSNRLILSLVAFFKGKNSDTKRKDNEPMLFSKGNGTATQDCHAGFRENISLYLQNGKAGGLSETTLDSYSRTLSLYARFTEQQDMIPEETASVLSYKLYLAENGRSKSTVSEYILQIDLFFRWAVDMKFYAENPVVKAIKPEAVKTNPYELKLTDEHIYSLLAGREGIYGKHTAMFPRNNAIMSLFLTTALRVSELCALTLDDLDFEAGRIKVRHGKGDKFRFVAFPKIAQQNFLNWENSRAGQELRRRANSGQSAAFLVESINNSTPHAFDRRTMSELMERHTYSITGLHGVRCHRLRHASASILLDKGVRTEDIQALLGHSSIATTKRYLTRLRPEAPAEVANDVFDSMFN